MKKINLLLYLFLILPIGVKSQNLQVFNGDFSCGLAQNGKAKYTYYEDPETHNYLKQGVFAFSIIGKGNLAGLNQTINGSFDKGLKNGLWTYKTIMTNMSAGNYYYTGTISLIANYKNGYANGNWKLIRSYKSKTWYTAYGPLKTMTVSMNFLNGSLVGNVSIVDEFGNFKATGNYDNNSMCVGTWKIDDFGWNKHRELIYKDNVLYEFVARDNNGEVQSGTTKYQEKYDNFSKAKAIPDNEKEDAEFQIVTDCGGDNSAATNNIKEYFKKLLSNSDFLYEQIGGDLTYKEGFKGGCEFSVSKTNFTPLADNNDYKIAEALNDKNKILEAFTQYLKINLKTIKPSEIKLVSEKISLIKPKISELIATYHANSKFFSESIKDQSDSLLTDFNSLKKDFKIKSVKEYNKYTYRYDEKSPKTVSYYCNCIEPWSLQPKQRFSEDPWLVSYDDNTLKCFDLNLEFYEPYQKFITKAFFYFNNALSSEGVNVRKSNLDFNFDNINNQFYTYDKSTFINNLKDAKNVYIQSKSLMNLYTKANEKKAEIETLNNNNKKRILLKKYTLIFDDVITKYNNLSNIDDIIKSFTDLIKITDKTILYYSQDTKALEEKLKETEIVEQIKSLLLE